MKKLFILIFSVLIFITSSGFGLIGSSTIVHAQLHQKSSKAEADKMKKNQNLASNIEEKKNAEKNQENEVAQSLIQWMADAIKSTLALMTEVLISVGKTILTSIIRLFN